jgi:hypothetical protein
MSIFLIETKTLATTTAAISFESIPQDGTDLIIKASLRHNAANATGTYISFNGTSSNLSGRYINALAPNQPTSTSLAGYIGSTTDDVTANVFNNTEVYISNYSGSTAKAFNSENVTENNGANLSYLNITCGLWADNSPITSLSIFTTSNSWRAGSTISLYKVTKGSGGATVS